MSGHRDPQSRPLAIPLACRQRGVPRAQTHPNNGRRGHRRRGSRRHLHDRPRGRRRPPPEDDDRQGRPGDLRPPGVLVSRASSTSSGEGQRRRPAVEARLQPDDGQFGTRRCRGPRSRARWWSAGRTPTPTTAAPTSVEDAIAAYTDALAWYITRDSRYAQKAIEIMDAWSAVITDHTNTNAPLQTGWAGSVWPRAAEIIRYTYTGWPPNVNRFATMLRNVYLPKVINGSNSNGNWELSMMEAAVGHRRLPGGPGRLRQGRRRTFRDRVPAFIYLSARRRPAQDAAGQRHRHPRRDHQLLAGPVHLHRRPDPGDLPRLRPHRLRHLGHLARRRDHPDPGSGPLPGDQRAAAPRAGLPVQVPARHRRAVLAVRRHAHPRPGPDHRGRLQRPAQPAGHRHDEHPALTEQQRPAGTNNLFVAWETLTHADNPA